MIWRRHLIATGVLIAFSCMAVHPGYLPEDIIPHGMTKLTKPVAFLAASTRYLE